MKNQNLYNYILGIADNSLILGQRMGELCGHGPSLETDIACTNISLDLFGQVRSYFQYAAKTAKSGRLISIDLKEMEPIGNTVQIQGDFTEEVIQDEIKKHIKDKIDVVMSDMAVNTTGIKNIDSIQTGSYAKKQCILQKTN